MKLNKIDHIGIIVNDLPAAKAFFLDFGLEAQWEGEMGGELVENIIGLENVQSDVVMLSLPEGQANLELIKYHSPSDEKGIQHALSNTLGIRHIAFVVDDIEAVVASMKQKGMELVGDIQNYEDTYKLRYCRGPEGIILELAQKLR